MTASQIRSLRKRLKLSQEALGARLGVTQKSISKWENGKQKPSKMACVALSNLAKETKGWYR